LKIPNTKTNNFHESNVEIHNLNREQKRKKNAPNKKKSTKLETTLGVLLLTNETNKIKKNRTSRH